MSGTTERLFSYGTLQQESVQLANFGRKLQGRADVVTGWRLSTVEITDPEVLAESGLAVHRIMVSGKPTDEVDGVVFEITPEELKAADSYETADYKRVKVKLRSGAEAWAYVAS
ncbi:MAG TPA: gamma-glutamylcyclotransferase family protein [Gammaproteobacteria bacterium]|jgi:gamma-glutamylcyclotransferase (GGCT)/AIG2-like uncharacterized protein YtfP